MGRRGIRIGATVGIVAALWETYRVASTTGDPMKQIVQTWTGWNGIQQQYNCRRNRYRQQDP
ncbi:unnamed protein product [marine sediment metagenome]|uniref:Uncharacterized protein n=1 Tax=marine sediment metagenome TaxID=412755 RepID=X0Z2L2_9ZZZZ